MIDAWSGSEVRASPCVHVRFPINDNYDYDSMVGRVRPTIVPFTVDL